MAKKLSCKRKSKIYIKRKLKFEGEFLYSWKRKGKEYIDGIWEFEGEFICGKKWNGKSYDKNKNVICEIINGNEKNIKLYDGRYGKLKYEGDYLNNQRNGKGKEYDSKDNLVYEGEYLNDERSEKNKRMNKLIKIY